MTERIIIDGYDDDSLNTYEKLKREKEINTELNTLLEKVIDETYELNEELQRKTAECENYKNKLQIATEALNTILDYIKDTNNGLGSLNIVRLTIVRKIIDTQQALEQIGAEK